MKSGSEKRTGADTPPRFRRRDWLIAAVAFALFLFCIAALLLLKLPRLGETFIERELRRRGLPDSECGVIALTPHRALLGPLRLGAEAGTPRARTAAVTYRLNALRRGSVDQVHLTGLELTLRYRDSAWRLVGLDALQRAMSSTAGAAAAAPPSPAALPPVQRVTVQDAELVLAHPTGNLRIAFTGAATFDAAGRVIFRATLSPNEDALQIRGSGDLNRGNLNVTLLPSRTRLEPWLAWLPLAGIMPPTPTPAVNGSVVIEAQAHWKDGRALDLRVDLHAPRVLIQEPWGQADLRDIRGRVEAGTDWRAATAEVTGTASRLRARGIAVRDMPFSASLAPATVTVRAEAAAMAAAGLQVEPATVNLEFRRGLADPQAAVCVGNVRLAAVSRGAWATDEIDAAFAWHRDQTVTFSANARNREPRFGLHTVAASGAVTRLDPLTLYVGGRATVVPQQWTGVSPPAAGPSRVTADFESTVEHEAAGSWRGTAALRLDSQHLTLQLGAGCVFSGTLSGDLAATGTATAASWHGSLTAVDPKLQRNTFGCTGAKLEVSGSGDVPLRRAVSALRGTRGMAQALAALPPLPVTANAVLTDGTVCTDPAATDRIAPLERAVNLSGVQGRIEGAVTETGDWRLGLVAARDWAGVQVIPGAAAAPLPCSGHAAIQAQVGPTGVTVQTKLGIRADALALGNAELKEAELHAELHAAAEQPFSPLALLDRRQRDAVLAELLRTQVNGELSGALAGCRIGKNMRLDDLRFMQPIAWRHGPGFLTPAGKDPALGQLQIHRLSHADLGYGSISGTCELRPHSAILDVRLAGSEPAVTARARPTISWDRGLAVETGFTIDPIDLHTVAGLVGKRLGRPGFDASGTAAVAGAITAGRDTRPHGQATLTLRAAGFTLAQSGIDVSGIAAEVDFRTLFPPRTAPGQRLTFAAARIGDMPIDGGTVWYCLESPASLFLERCRLKWCGGLLETHAVRFNPARPELALTVYADSVDLARVLDVFQGLRGKGTGTLYGKLPLTIRSNRVTYEDGFLYSVPGQGGTLKLRGAGWLTATVPETAPQHEELKHAEQALGDFRYDLLTFDFDGEGTTDTRLRLRLAGRAADPARPQPVDLNVNIRGPLESLLNTGLQMRRLAQ